MTRLPVKLHNDPIVEAAFEIRFQSKMEAVSDLLPGMLFTKFKDHFGTPKRLPIAELPRQILESDVNLRYQPRLKMEGERFSIFIGDRVALVNCVRPYSGWVEFRSLILDVLEKFKEIDFISTVERLSLKYVNLLEASSPQEQFARVKVAANLGDYRLTDWPTSFRTEITDEGIINLVDVKSRATVTIKKKGQSEALKGLLVTIDSIHRLPENFWENRADLINKIHQTEKKLFFSLLTEKTVEQFGADWE